MKRSHNLNTIWPTLIGNETSFSMESRIFNAVTLFAVMVGTINALVNFVLGLIVYGLLMVPLIVALFLSYYLSRFRKKLSLAIGILAISANLLCAGTYFSSNASNGVNLITFILIIFILTLVSSKNEFWIWVPLTLTVVIGLLTIEYFYPSLSKPLYTDPNHKLLDLSQTLFEVIGMIILITLFIKKSYNREKELADHRHIDLEKTNATKNKLFSIVSHDLKSPLASIENYLSLLNKIELSKEEKISIENNLLISTRQTSEMLQNILSWSKDQMHGITPKLMPCQLHKTLHHTISFQHSLAKQKQVDINYTPNHDVNVVADPDMLQLIIRNLLNNSIKFSNPGSSIHLKVEEENDQCIIMISDSGIGIAEEKRPTVFSSENKGTYGTNGEKGVGLGLNLAKTYIELQNGKIWFKSAIDLGTTFYVSIPKSG